MSNHWRTLVRVAMWDRGWSTHRLSKETGLSAPGLKKALTDGNDVHLSTVEAIGKALGLDFDVTDC